MARERHPPLSDDTYRGAQFLSGGMFQQIAVGPGLDHLADIRRSGKRREYQDARRRSSRLDSPYHLRADKVGQGEIGDDQIDPLRRSQALVKLDPRRTGGSLADDDDTVIIL